MSRKNFYLVDIEYEDSRHDISGVYDFYKVIWCKDTIDTIKLCVWFNVKDQNLSVLIGNEALKKLLRPDDYMSFISTRFTQEQLSYHLVRYHYIRKPFPKKRANGHYFVDHLLFLLKHINKNTDISLYYGRDVFGWEL